MNSFKVGDAVKVVAGPRAGEVTTVIGPLRRYLGRPGERYVARGDWVYEIGLTPTVPGTRRVVALPEWLRPYREGWEKSEWTDELLSLCKPKERV